MTGRCWAQLRRPMRAVPALESALGRYDDRRYVLGVMPSAATTAPGPLCGSTRSSRTRPNEVEATPAPMITVPSTLTDRPK